MDVALFIPCGMDAFFPEAGTAARASISLVAHSATADPDRIARPTDGGSSLDEHQHCPGRFGT
jgi:hypothetical protein